MLSYRWDIYHHHPPRLRHHCGRENRNQRLERVRVKRYLWTPGPTELPGKCVPAPELYQPLSTQQGGAQEPPPLTEEPLTAIASREGRDGFKGVVPDR